MKRLLEVSAIFSVTIIVTAVTVAAVVPVHPRGTPEATEPQVDIAYAVTSSGTEEPTTVAGCPYLSAIATSSACPALPQTAATVGCPFFDGQPAGESPKHVRKPTGQHT